LARNYNFDSAFAQRCQYSSWAFADKNIKARGLFHYWLTKNMGTNPREPEKS